MFEINFLTRRDRLLTLLYPLVSHPGDSMTLQDKRQAVLNEFITNPDDCLTPPVLDLANLDNLISLHDDPSIPPRPVSAEVGRVETVCVNLVDVVFRYPAQTTYPWEKVLDQFLHLQELAAVRFQSKNRADLLGFVEAQRSTLNRYGLLVFGETGFALFEDHMFYVDLKVTRDLG
jgi:hypothetical protein